MIHAELVLSSNGTIYLENNSLSDESIPSSLFEKLSTLFAKSSFTGLLHLGIQAFNAPLPTSFLFWQLFSRKFISQVCRLTQNSDEVDFSSIQAPSHFELQEIINSAFTLPGKEHLSREILLKTWEGLTTALKNEMEYFSGNIQDYLKSYNPEWNVVGRICFHLAENKKDENKPFAFLATYTNRMSQQATAQHLPLKRALQESLEKKDQSSLLSLLIPVQRAAQLSPFVKELVDTSAIFQAQAWTAREAYRFLQEIPSMESSGIMIRVPNWWKPQKPPIPKVNITIGENQNSTLNLNALLDFDMQLALSDGTSLTKKEWQSLLKSSDTLVKIKDTWVEIDRKKLESVLNHWEAVQKSVQNGLSISESLKLLSGLGNFTSRDEEVSNIEDTKEWSTVLAGSWLENILDQLKDPSATLDKSLEKTLEKHLKATLRPYQVAGVQWLRLLYNLKLGGCLADDMGLGKTIQVLSLLILIKHLDSLPSKKKAHLLVVPASLLGNWTSEIKKFTPSLQVLIIHRSVGALEEPEKEIERVDLVITTYGNIQRSEWIQKASWDLCILDEAQLIKNPGAKQTKAIKEIHSEIRFTLTGTPVENKLNDLWSLFDFTSPGLLGSNKAFTSYTKKAGKDSSSEGYSHFMTTLRKITQPYILRRVKSDKSIISDLPDKTEMQSYCSLTKDQIRLYQQAISELSAQLEKVEGIKRQGLILSYLLRFKQICNHPDQWLGYGEYHKEASGKWLRLQEICEEIAAKREKVLIFTQFTEIIPPLAAFLSKVFGREGLILHGKTPIKERPKLVEAFQQEQGPPFFVLSLKAGGTGLTLTRASHVIHFDRWWNPAVENQATDRAYRIGQKHPVLVHKFICRGTIEEKIDELIIAKKNLSNELLLKDEKALTLTELSNKELLDLISLDIQKALGEF